MTSESTFQDLDQSDNPPPLEAAAGSFAPTLATTITAAPSSAGGIPISTPSADTSHGMAPELVKLDVRRATEVVVPTATLLGQTVSIRGNGAEMVGGVEGAVDRIATEIVRRLEQGRTLVVWAFDASGSLQAERQRLVKHIETIYTHINQLDENHLSSDNGLLTMVVAFGHDHRALLPKPTAERSEIVEAIKSVPLDTTGDRDDFHDGRRYRSSLGPLQRLAQPNLSHDGHRRDRRGRRRRTSDSRMPSLRPRKPRCPSMCWARRRSSGAQIGYVDYVDPKTKHLFRNVEVRQGPESVALEQIRLPFWYGGPQYEIVEAGFGPFALSRLASATGGIYFITRFDTRRMGFDPARMREYRPDWVRRDEYEKEVNRSPLRQAVLTAAQITQQKLPGMPSHELSGRGRSRVQRGDGE